MPVSKVFLPAMTPELVTMYKSHNFAVDISKIVQFWVIALYMKIENHLGYKLPLHRL